MRVLVNAGNLVAGGPRLVLENLLPAIARSDASSSFVALIPSSHRNAPWLREPNLEVHFTPRGVPRLARRLYEVLYQVPRLCRMTGADVCLTLGDVGPVTLPVPHVVMLHNAYIGFQATDIPPVFSLLQRAKIAYLRWHFSKIAQQCSRIIVQTPVMAEGTQRSYGVTADHMVVIPSTTTRVAQTLMAGGVQPDTQVSSVPQALKLVFLSAIYPHKNHLVMPELMAELRRRGLTPKVHVFLTFDPQRKPDLMRALDGYSDCVTNLGALDGRRLPSVLAAAGGLLLPTLMESFGLVYLEAMAAKLPILTSNLPFARWICGDLATYFEPMDPCSIANAIEALVEEGKSNDYDERAIKRLREFPADWNEVARSYLDLLEGCVTR